MKAVMKHATYLSCQLRCLTQTVSHCSNDILQQQAVLVLGRLGDHIQSGVVLQQLLMLLFPCVLSWLGTTADSMTAT